METGSVHLIDENKKFNAELVGYLNTCYPPKSDDNGLNYHIVSVFGSQSSGKSTLLNRLFGTKFDVMDELKRQQTTKGIWFSHANHIASTKESGLYSNDSNIFVLDVEGADGRERADDKDFERKAALFALSTSEVLIVNIWENQIGLYQGANMELLKTVLEVNLSLFHSNKQKILLLFVIRDFSGATNISNLSETLTKDMNNTWASLSKPEGAQDCKLSDFFDLAFFAIGHKRFQPEEFELNIKQLGDKFHSTTDNIRIFEDDYHRKIPIDAWALYSEQIWAQIEENKDLDLPTQQILVARFRCDEILNDAFQKFTELFKSFDFISIVDDIERVVANLIELRDSGLAIYDLNAQRYIQSVYLERRQILENKIDLMIKPVQKAQIDRIKKSLFLSLPERILAMKKEKKLTAFGEILSSVSLELQQLFSTDIEKLKISASFSTANELDEFKDLLTEQIEEIKIKERDHLISRLSRNFQRKFKEFVIELLAKPNNQSWDNILNEFNSLLDIALAKYKKDDMYDFKLGLQENLNLETSLLIKKLFWSKFYDIIHDYISEDTVSRILRSLFEDYFRYDLETDLPRVWSSVDEIDKCFTESKNLAIKAIPILSTATLSNNSEIIPDVDISHENDHEFDYEEESDSELVNHSFAHLLTTKQQVKVQNRFKKESDAIYLDAKRSIVSNIQKIPYYIYMIIVVLGWNEFMIILRNPLLITLCIVIVTGTYFAYNTKTLGPILSVAKVTLNHTKVVAKERLRDILLDEKESKSAKSSDSSVSESIELENLN